LEEPNQFIEDLMVTQKQTKKIGAEGKKALCTTVLKYAYDHNFNRGDRSNRLEYKYN
jgi:hypothetical protein